MCSLAHSWAHSANPIWPFVAAGDPYPGGGWSPSMSGDPYPRGGWSPLPQVPILSISEMKPSDSAVAPTGRLDQITVCSTRGSAILQVLQNGSAFAAYRSGFWGYRRGPGESGVSARVWDARRYGGPGQQAGRRGFQELRLSRAEELHSHVRAESHRENELDDKLE
ncbi:unnamed protein product [Lota lota]